MNELAAFIPQKNLSVFSQEQFKKYVKSLRNENWKVMGGPTESTALIFKTFKQNQITGEPVTLRAELGPANHSRYPAE